ncbi:hypothetical protein GCM10023310_69620 [Paenibacillus vulneris]|uniref:Uncharacterized protein n=1 Tax=Paenibacillus vulneris TaxID=1133364 RepID=A0ABW3UGA5_9BACL
MDKYSVGHKVKLSTSGLYRLFGGENSLKERYQDQDAIISEVISEEGYYLIAFQDNFVTSVTDNEITLVEGESASSEKGYFETLATDIGKLVDKKQIAYGNSVDKTYRLMQIYLEKWRNEDNTYTIPESLIKHILLQVRIIDKQNRIFNNPAADLMQENCYLDITGYGLLGHRMME